MSFLDPRGGETAQAAAEVSPLYRAGFDELMSKTTASATVDRLLHHAHLVMTTVDSIRLTQDHRQEG